MSIVKIDDVYLYANEYEETSECYEAKKWLEDNGIEHEFMYYGEAEAHQRLFESASINWPDQPPLNKFPFLVYTEIHDNLRPSQYPQVCLRSLEEIKNSNLELLYKLGRS